MCWCGFEARRRSTRNEQWILGQLNGADSSKGLRVDLCRENLGKAGPHDFAAIGQRWQQ